MIFYRYLFKRLTAKDSCYCVQCIRTAISILEKRPNQVLHFFRFIVQRQWTLSLGPLLGDVRHRRIQHHLQLT